MMTTAAKCLLWSVLLFLPFGAAQARTELFTYPNIKEAYCGNHISAVFCQCAFHGKNCETANTDRRGASAKVMDGFQEFVERQITMFGMRCVDNGGIYSVITTRCEYCEGGKVRSEGTCVNPEDKRPLEEVYRLPKVETQGGSADLGFVTLGEGEVFVYSPGRGKWIGPVRGGLHLYEGDVVHTTEHGRAKIRLGTTNMVILERSTLTLPSPKRERGLLERGALFIWENVKRLATNQPYEIEGGAHSITAIKGTKFMMEVDGDVATYTLNDGAIDVWSKEDPSSKIELKPGESAQVTAAGVARAAYDWDALIGKYDLADQDLSEPEPPKSTAFIDPDAVNPPEAAYSGDLVGNAAARAKIPGSGTWKWALGLAVLAAAAFVAKKRFMTGKR